MQRLRGALLLATIIFAAVGCSRVGAQVPEPPDVHVPAPDLPGSVRWLNSPPLSMEKLRGKVVLIDFWEYTCVNCISTLPYLKSWWAKYKDKGLVIIGVHTPEFQFAREDANVAKAVKDFGLTYPIIIDSDYLVWRAYGNQYWPAKYLIDANGFVRYAHFGEGSYGQTEAKIQSLLRAANPRVSLPPIGQPVRGRDKPGAVCFPMTRELYAGFSHGAMDRTFGSPEGYRPGQVVDLTAPAPWDDGKVYANGEWRCMPEALVSTRENNGGQDYVAIRYHALEVNSVLKPEDGKPVKVWVLHNGRPVASQDKGDDIKYDPDGRSYLLVNEPRMYNIIKNAKFGQKTLQLAPEGPGLGVYSYTFESCEAGKAGKR